MKKHISSLIESHAKKNEFHSTVWKWKGNYSKTLPYTYTISRTFVFMEDRFGLWKLKIIFLFYFILFYLQKIDCAKAWIWFEKKSRGTFVKSWIQIFKKAISLYFPASVSQPPTPNLPRSWIFRIPGFSSPEMLLATAMCVFPEKVTLHTLWSIERQKILLSRDKEKLMFLFLNYKS